MTPVLFQPDLLGALTFLISFLLPLLVGLITTKVTSAGVKAVLLAAASLITSVATSWAAALQSNQPFDLWTALLTFGGVFVVAVASHFGVWKPVGASAAAQAVGAGEHVAGPEVSTKDQILAAHAALSTSEKEASEQAALSRVAGNV